MAYGIAYMLIKDVCDAIPSALRSHGAAFACGFGRISSVLALFAVAAIHIYCIFTVWSLCEDLRQGGTGVGGLPALVEAKGELKR